MTNKDKSKIRLLIVDDNPATVDNLSKMLYFEHELEIVGTAGSGKQALAKCQELRPDVVLMDVNMPEMDGIQTTEVMRVEVPNQVVVLMSVQGELEYVRRAMVAGASDYLTKPFTSDELVNSLRKVYEKESRKPKLTVVPTTTQLPTSVIATDTNCRGKVVAIFSPKGGVGRTTVAINLAASIRQITNQRVAVVDLSLVFGDVGVLLNLQGKTITDLLPYINDLEPEILNDIMVSHTPSGLQVLLAPPRPEMADIVTAEHINKIIAKMRDVFDFIIVDTFPSFHDSMLAVLDAADEIIVVTTLEIHSLKNIKLFMETAETLGYTAKKVTLVVNRADSITGITVADVETHVNQKVVLSIINDWKLASFSANRGIPFVISNRESTIAKNYQELARIVALGEVKQNGKEAVGAKGGTRRLAWGRFGR